MHNVPSRSSLVLFEVKLNAPRPVIQTGDETSMSHKHFFEKRDPFITSSTNLAVRARKHLRQQLEKGLVTNSHFKRKKKKPSKYALLLAAETMQQMLVLSSRHAAYHLLRLCRSPLSYIQGNRTMLVCIEDTARGSRTVGGLVLILACIYNECSHTHAQYR